METTNLDFHSPDDRENWVQVSKVVTLFCRVAITGIKNSFLLESDYNHELLAKKIQTILISDKKVSKSPRKFTV